MYTTHVRRWCPYLLHNLMYVKRAERVDVQHTSVDDEQRYRLSGQHLDEACKAVWLGDVHPSHCSHVGKGRQVTA